MKWKDFLNKLASQTSVEIVGPFASGWSPGQHAVIYVDSGIHHQKPCALSTSVGDADSSTAPLDMMLEKEKNFSDFTFALRSLPQNIAEVHARGFLGGRRDHELANFGEAHAFLRARLKPTRVSWDEEGSPGARDVGSLKGAVPFR